MSKRITTIACNMMKELCTQQQYGEISLTAEQAKILSKWLRKALRFSNKHSIQKLLSGCIEFDSYGLQGFSEILAEFAFIRKNSSFLI